MRGEDCNRRLFLKRLGAACGISSFAFGDAAGAPTCRDVFAGKSVRWIVPQPPGGGYDRYSRLVAPFVARKLGVSFVVENIVGAGGSVGLRVLADASPDGTTMAVMNAPGMVVASLLGDENAPNPLTEFTILGRLAETPQVWATPKGSGLRNIHDVLDAAGRRPVLVGIQDVESTNFAGFTVGSFLIGLDSELVVGYRGTAAASMGALRGEVDLIGFTFHSIRSQIDAGDLTPVLQLSDARISPHASLEGVAVLGGINGFAVERARELNRDPERARDDADALLSVMNLGRVLVVPRGIAPAVHECLDVALYETLTEPELQSAASRASLPLAPARAAETEISLGRGVANVGRFLPLLREAMRRARG